jgi:uncharacterized membrane protein YfcA
MTPEVVAGVLLLALAASTLGGVLGFGTGAIMLPVMTLVLGVRVAVPVMALAMTMTNAGRAVFSWRDIDWKAFLALAGASIPASMIGATLFVNMDTRWLDVFIAGTLLLLIPGRRWSARAHYKTRLRDLPVVAGVGGLISGMGGVTGPLATPFLLSYGLVRSAFLGTDGLYSALTHATKAGVFAANGALASPVWEMGLALGGVMVLGAYVGRRIVDRLDATRYIAVVEVFLGGFALYMLVRAVSAF